MVHDIVIDELEQHLSGGGLLKSASRAFYAHLDECSACRAQVAQMEEMSGWFRELRFDSEAAGETGIGVTAVEPSLGFYSRVRYRIVDDKRKEAWGLFSPGAAFFRRVVFASLLLLAGLGSFLVSRDSSFGGASLTGTDAASIMAQHDPVAAHSESSDRDRMLVTLATYRE
jgi:anti-sigma factor RsiW